MKYLFLLLFLTSCSDDQKCLKLPENGPLECKTQKEWNKTSKDGWNIVECMNKNKNISLDQSMVKCHVKVKYNRHRL
jgi:hypothetical protein